MIKKMSDYYENLQKKYKKLFAEYEQIKSDGSKNELLQEQVKNSLKKIREFKMLL
ncbi:hypothetical protein [Nitrosopumilus ureiphilus]|uniref:hypothetical protein n=1 Tax=Nitrosopumilus ureiphilus TaxID=1470067 RepID=UPI001FEC2967|nr:hypothetical protein [Nitrosopumilus ureiphilus]